MIAIIIATEAMVEKWVILPIIVMVVIAEKWVILPIIVMVVILGKWVILYIIATALLLDCAKIMQIKNIYKGTILVLLFLFAGCASKVEILPKISENKVQNYEIHASFDNNKTYMRKYLPANVIVQNDAPLFVDYHFIDNVMNGDTKADVLHLYNPLTIIGFPVGSNSLQIGANLRFFNNSDEIKFSAVCVAKQARNLFSNANTTELRKKCIPQLQKNLQMQINQKFKQGEFNVFK